MPYLQSNTVENLIPKKNKRIKMKRMVMKNDELKWLTKEQDIQACYTQSTQTFQLSSIPRSDVLNVLRSWRWWGNMDTGPPDPVIGIKEEYDRDTDPNKINLIVGVYTDESGQPWVLPSVRKAEALVYKTPLDDFDSHEQEYTDAVTKLAFGDDSEVVRDKLHCTVQTIAGTGALRVGLEFIKNYFTKNKEIWLPTPTWNNHHQICKAVDLPYKQYRYFNPETMGFDAEGALEDICNIPEGSIILLHACAHNPTGVDPTTNEWQMLSQAILERNLFPFFDMAYQGLATGNVDKDAAALRLFVTAGHQVLLAQSFVKNMGLYGERAGALTILNNDKEVAANLTARVKTLIRNMYFKPPMYGARLVSEILNKPDLKQQWLQELKQMAYRIKRMRAKLRNSIEEAGSKRSWAHLTNQKGIFSYSGLTLAQIKRLAKEFNVYLSNDGRISMAGLTDRNVHHVAGGMHAVTS